MRSFRLAPHKSHFHQMGEGRTAPLVPAFRPSLER